MSVPKARQLRVNVTPALHDALAKRAVALDVSQAQIVRQALRNYLKGRK